MPPRQRSPGHDLIHAHIEEDSLELRPYVLLGELVGKPPVHENDDLVLRDWVLEDNTVFSWRTAEDTLQEVDGKTRREK